MSAQPHQAGTSGQRLPLYRREPWLAVMLVAFIVMVASMLLPVEYRRWPAILAGVLGTAGLILLMFHRPHPDSDRHLRDIRLPHLPAGGGKARVGKDDRVDDDELHAQSAQS